MRDLNWFGKYCAPFGRRKGDGAQHMNLDDAPIATRLRSRDKEVEDSQTMRNNGATGSKNQTADKQSQNVTHQSNQSEVMKSTEVHSSSSSRRTRQQSRPLLPHEIHRPRQLSEGPNKSNETKSPSKNYEHTEEQVIANKRFTQPKSEANNASSSSQVRREKMNNVRLSEQSSEHRPLEDPDDLPVVEPRTGYIRYEESQRQPVGWTCELCERDVGVSPFEKEEEEDSDLYPEASVFPCGHVYHTSCLRFQFGDQDLSDDSCIFCLTLFP